MPEERTRRRAEHARSKGKAPSTQAGEYVREEIHHVREGKHGARSSKQAIAIGLSKARRAGVSLPPPETSKASENTRRKARRDSARGQRGTANRSAAARKAARTRGPARKAAAKKAARAREAHTE
jgi:hypothetical protein